MKEKATSDAREEARDEPIHSRWLSVSYYRPNPRGRDEQLIYAPQAMEDSGTTAPVHVPIRSDLIRPQLRALREAVYDLTRSALAGTPRGSRGIEEAASALAKRVLPKNGLAQLVGFGIHPQFQVFQDIASEIPWEAMEETYSSCANPSCRHFGVAGSPAFEPYEARYCPYCQSPIDLRGGKLALTLHLSHAVTGERGAEQSGRCFFLFIDPTGDLCSAKNDAQGICRMHVEQLTKLLEDMGYEVCIFEGPSVTAAHFLAALTDPRAVGVYYFGHGLTEAREGFLKLADGELGAERIAEAAATTRFVFLNACEGAYAGGDWNPEDTNKSVAAALAHSGRWKTVIAPLWPIVNVQAAEAALTFFRAARPSRPLGEAMREVRKASLQKYQGGEAHLSWFLYRFFGSPSRPLPAPNDDRETTTRGTTTRPRSRIFDSEIGLNTEVFGFAIDEVLSRAAKRRSQHGRPRISKLDLAAGLIRRGDLTRYVLGGLLVHPDALLERMDKPLPSETGGGASNDSAPAVQNPSAPRAEQSTSPEEKGPLATLAKLTVRDRRELDDDVLRLLDAADMEAQRREGADRRIAERDLLEQVLTEGTWGALPPGLPTADDVRGWMQVVLGRGEVDENGRISLTDLTPEARKVVETAHNLAQQRGLSPISHRLMLAAFLSSDKGQAATSCKALGIEAEEIFSFMLASQEFGGRPPASSPQNFGLSPELCERAVAPALESARRAAASWRGVTERDLFNAFCERADPAFKQWLGIFGLDLDAIAQSRHGRVDLELTARPENVPDWFEKLSPGARDVLAIAYQLSRRLGASPIPNHLFLAAFLYDRDRYLPTLLAETGVSNIEQLRDRLIERSALLGRASTSFPLDDSALGPSVAAAVRAALERQPGVGAVDERMLFVAFCRAAPEEFRRALTGSGWFVDIELLCEAAQADSGEARRGASEPPPSSAPTPPDRPAAAHNSTVGGNDLSVTLPSPLQRGHVDEKVWRCLLQAALLARAQGWSEIRSPHLFGGMLTEGIAVPRLGALSTEQRQGFLRLVLSLVPERTPLGPGPVSVSQNAAVALDRAVKRARKDKREQASINDVTDAFFEGGGGVVGELIQRVLAEREKGPVQAPPSGNRGNRDLN